MEGQNKVAPLLISRAQFKEYIGVSWSTVYRHLNDSFKGFPQPVIIGGTKAVYKLEEIKKFITQMQTS